MPHAIVIPEHEFEVVRAGRERSADPDRVPTTALREAWVGGARLTSRHRKAHELAHMACIVAGMPHDLSPFIREVSCLSEQGRVYAVALGPWDVDVARDVAREMDRMGGALGGHGGIDVRPHEGGHRQAVVHVDARWPDDFEVDDRVP